MLGVLPCTQHPEFHPTGKMHPLHEKGWEKWSLVDFRGPISTPFCGIFFLVLVFLTIASAAQDEREVLCVCYVSA